MSSAEMASTTPTAFFLTFKLFCSEPRRPVTTTTVLSEDAAGVAGAAVCANTGAANASAAVDTPPSTAVRSNLPTR